MQPQLPAQTVEREATDIWSRLPRPLEGPRVVASSIALAAGTTALGHVALRWLPQQSIGLLYLLAVVVAAVGLGTWTGLAVAVLSFLAYNFFFIPPVFTFTIADPQELFALFVFLVVALVTGQLAGRMRAVADAARARAFALQSLNDFAALLSGTRDEASILGPLAAQVAQVVGGEAVALKWAGDGLALVGASPPTLTLSTADWQSAGRALRSRQVAAASASGWPGGRIEFHPIVAGDKAFGVVGIVPPRDRRLLRLEHEASLDTLLRHVGIALERTRLEGDSVRARSEIERERLRSALLSSLSHDLKTPLASIIGAVTSLRELGRDMSPAMRDDLLLAIEEEAERLSRFVNNLLQMTRLEAHDIDLVGDWLDLGDVVRTAVKRARKLAPDAHLTLDLPTTPPAIRGDATLLEHVVFNLIENAIKFSAPPAKISVALSASGDHLRLTVEDQGRGIPHEAQQRIFEPFYRVQTGDHGVAGTGLGLAIAKRVIERMGGSISVESPARDGHGARFAIILPIPARDDAREGQRP